MKKHIPTFCKLFAFFGLLCFVGESPLPIWQRLLYAASFSGAILIGSILLIKLKIKLSDEKRKL